ncbi:ROK family glucokinase [Alteribacillus sp. HJP-4]|uniref:ROK family glucokinase n=1 Tax=Alteribacillus sp. HJP-4 TaxID=2775394 RepID=UPI0035CD20EA
MQAAYVLGIDVGGTAVKMAVFTEDAEMKQKWSIPTNKTNNGESILDDISASFHEMVEREGYTKDQFIGAGVGVPGFIDMEEGVIEFAVNIGWRNYPITALLSEKLGVPVRVDNDANLAAAGEFWKGAGSDVEDLILFTLGTGVGGGLIVKGDIIHGVGGMGGEIGHVTVIPEGGAPCNCGKTGCLETVSSATGMVRLAHEAAKEFPTSKLTKHYQDTGEMTTKEIFAFSADGDEAARKVVDISMYYLGLSAANIANVLNPAKIVIGGGVSAAGDDLLKPLTHYYNKYALEKVKSDSTFVLAELGNDAGVAGAAWLAKQYVTK